MTNDKAIKNLVKALDKEGPMFYALLKERILHIMNITMADMENNPDAWKNTFFHTDVYKRLDEIVYKHLAFKD
jgi:hypothetical protein